MSTHEHTGKVDLFTLVEANRVEARKLFEGLVDNLPQEMAAVAGLMASVDLVARILFSSIDTVSREKGLADPNDAAVEAIRLLQELLNIRLTYELAVRGIAECDCPNCQSLKQELKQTVHVKLH